VRMRYRDEVVRDADVVELAQPPRGKLVEHLALERHRPDDEVEHRDAVGDGDREAIADKLEHLAHLAGELTPSRPLGEAVDSVVECGGYQVRLQHAFSA